MQMAGPEITGDTTAGRPCSESARNSESDRDHAGRRPSCSEPERLDTG
jgi:hypothetical protein